VLDGNNPHIKEQQTQWWKENVQKEKQRSKKHIYSIYAEILNKIFLVLMFSNDIFNIYFNLLSSRLHMLYFVLFRCVTSYLFYFCSWQTLIHLNRQFYTICNRDCCTVFNNWRETTLYHNVNVFQRWIRDSYYFCMVNCSGPLKIVDINYENVLTFIELCFSRKDVKWQLMGRAP
jgi:hypothetical protein